MIGKLEGTEHNAARLLLRKVRKQRAVVSFHFYFASRNEKWRGFGRNGKETLGRRAGEMASGRMRSHRRASHFHK